MVYGGIKHVKTKLAFSVMHLPMKGQWRHVFARMGGVRFADNQSFIGDNVSFDTVFPELISIGRHVHITAGVIFLTHSLDTKSDGVHWLKGEIVIGDNVFIGTNSIITKPLRIGNNVIIGAGSVVTKDIPDNEIWAGNPAKFIKKRF